MAITTFDGLIAAMAAGPTIGFNKQSMGAPGTGWGSLFRSAGLPAAAAVPTSTSGVTLDRTSVGALPIPAPSATSYISSFECCATAVSTIAIADRLVESGGLNGTLTTAQTVGTPALPARATTATDVEMWLEWYTGTGATAVTATVTYTNQVGVTGRTSTLALAASVPGNRSLQMPLQAGDTGVQSVQSVLLSASTGSAGNFGVVLRRTLLTGPIVAANIGFVQGYAETDLQRLPDNACVEVMSLFNSGTGTILGNVGVCQG